MSVATKPEPLQLPAALERQLFAFRRRVWTIKLIEALAFSAFGIVCAFLMTYALDRVTDTPGWVRLALLGVLVAFGLAVPWALYYWVWRRRQLEQLARLLGHRHASIGDQLLGIIELVHSPSEQARSRALCEAAIVQVAEQARERDFRDAVPHPRHRRWLGLALGGLAVTLGLALLYPAAAANAWARLLTPWRAIPRYTFTMIRPLPERLVVAYGEPFVLPVSLHKTTRWQPAEARLELPGQPPLRANLTSGRYSFAIPGLIEPVPLRLRVGDLAETVLLDPKLRPELTSVEAQVTLPAYLERARPVKHDARGGSVTLVKGSRATFAATANRDLIRAQVNARAVKPRGAQITTPAASIDGPAQIEFKWQDHWGLEGKEPFSLTIDGREDEAPSLLITDLPRQKVVLDSEQLTFAVRADDDFGVKRVGITWRGVDPAEAPIEGERVLAAGGSDRELLEVTGTFSAKSLGIPAQPLEVRLFAEDYLPGRERVYSPTYTLYVLTPEQHAIWLTEQLSKWHRQSLEVRDRELQLYETNKQLRELTAEQLDEPETRKRLETQAAAERTNGRRLSGLVSSGEELVRQAMRNPEFGVGHLEKWAEMLQILKDISSNRMPSVAELLAEAAEAPNRPSGGSANRPPAAGQVRASTQGTPNGDPKPGTPPPVVPQVVDRESSQGVGKPGEQPEEKPRSPGKSSPRLTLPTTTLVGSGKGGQCPAGEKTEQALAEQRDLLAEFDKVAAELNQVLANLEGSTLVKRLKAAARQQYAIAGRIADHVDDAFGVFGSQNNGPQAELFRELSQQETSSSHTVSIIMDDMEAYFERRRMVKFKAVLDEMREQDVIGSLRRLSDDLVKEEGLSIAQCEFWSDTLDRWAEDLVDPACSGACPGSKSRSSLPPSIVLEVLKILEGEVNLREDTRVAEQARPAINAEEHVQRAEQLATMQNELEVRTQDVVKRILELPDAEAEFARELRLLAQVISVMHETVGILRQPETGAPAIAAETEVIELLLQSRRINPRGGGGGGASPGGGGSGTTTDAALALIGRGKNEREVREDRGTGQSTGQTGPQLPEEFRAGLDEYFNRLEQSRTTP